MVTTTTTDGSVRIWDAGSGKSQVITNRDGSVRLWDLSKSSDASVGLTGFAIAGEDKKFVWAKAEVQGDKVVVRNPEVPHPVAVRYGWADFPVVNLFNKEGLPASPFRTDDFPMITQGKK